MELDALAKRIRGMTKEKQLTAEHVESFVRLMKSADVDDGRRDDMQQRQLFFLLPLTWTTDQAILRRLVDCGAGLVVASWLKGARSDAIAQKCLKILGALPMTVADMLAQKDVIKAVRSVVKRGNARSDSMGRSLALTASDLQDRWKKLVAATDESELERAKETAEQRPGTPQLHDGCAVESIAESLKRTAEEAELDETTSMSGPEAFRALASVADRASMDVDVETNNTRGGVPTALSTDIGDNINTSDADDNNLFLANAGRDVAQRKRPRTISPIPDAAISTKTSRTIAPLSSSSSSSLSSSFTSVDAHAPRRSSPTLLSSSADSSSASTAAKRRRRVTFAPATRLVKVEIVSRWINVDDSKPSRPLSNGNGRENESVREGAALRRTTERLQAAVPWVRPQTLDVPPLVDTDNRPVVMASVEAEVQAQRVRSVLADRLSTEPIEPPFAEMRHPHAEKLHKHAETILWYELESPSVHHTAHPHFPPPPDAPLHHDQLQQSHQPHQPHQPHHLSHPPPPDHYRPQQKQEPHQQQQQQQQQQYHNHTQPPRSSYYTGHHQHNHQHHQQQPEQRHYYHSHPPQQLPPAERPPARHPYAPPPPSKYPPPSLNQLSASSTPSTSTSSSSTLNLSNLSSLAASAATTGSTNSNAFGTTSTFKISNLLAGSSSVAPRFGGGGGLSAFARSNGTSNPRVTATTSGPPPATTAPSSGAAPPARNLAACAFCGKTSHRIRDCPDCSYPGVCRSVVLTRCPAASTCKFYHLPPRD